MATKRIQIDTRDASLIATLLQKEAKAATVRGATATADKYQDMANKYWAIYESGK